MSLTCIHGDPPRALIAPPPGAVQVSPRRPGGAVLEDMAPASLDAAILSAPDGVVERRGLIAAALRALKVGGELAVLAPKTRGGSRLSKELAAFGLSPVEDYKRGWRMVRARRPEAVSGLDEALAEAGPQQVAGLGWSQPGVFSWNRPDPGSLLLTKHLNGLSGRGADLGCGTGLLARTVLTSGAVTQLLLVDLDRRAVAAAKRNVEDARVHFLWADALALAEAELDFVVMNPPFHDGGTENRGLGAAFIGKAAAMLRKGGALRLVANRHLPYEAPLASAFSRITPLADVGGFKVIEAVK